ncbi:MAG: DUF1003 domain-containing protein [Candidatus Binatia bacterium]
MTSTGAHDPTQPAQNAARQCALCARYGRRHEFVPAAAVRHQVAAHIAEKFPDTWTGAGFICRTCLNAERGDYVVWRIEQERGSLSAVEADVARKAGESLVLAEHLDEEFARNTTYGQRAADATARIGGSWSFVISFGVVLAIWIVINSFVLAGRAFDPYPYILLNLALSCLAALQAPIIMMAQNRQTARDRAQADQDFRVNLHAEIAILNLHEKVDHLLHAQWERLIELQQIQIDLIEEIAEGRRARRTD